MENHLSEKFKNLPQAEFPADLHNRILNGIVSSRVRRGFATVFSVLLLNLLVAGYFLITRLIHNDAFTPINFMMREFELSEGYFTQLASILYHSISLGLLLTMIFNIILMRYVLKIGFYFKNKNVGRAFFSKI